jgi:molecular chaperone GrpE
MNPVDRPEADELSEMLDQNAENPPISPETRIAELEGEVALHKDRVLRTLAEAENARRRHERQIADERVFAIEKFARDLLSVSDNLGRALETLTPQSLEALGETGRTLVTGVEMTQKSLHATFARHGVTALDAAPGATFDPNLHQAVTQIPSDQPKGTIAVCFTPGWRLGDRVLRAAMVAVSLGAAN